MWYLKCVKRYGACSLREGGLSFGRPAPLQFGPNKAEGRVVERTQVVDFPDISAYFPWFLVLGERDRPGRCGVRLAPRSDRKRKTRDLVGETPTKAVETTALPRNRVQENSCPLAFTGDSKRKSLISRIVSDSFG
jgi:hypothetical protein